MLKTASRLRRAVINVIIILVLLAAAFIAGMVFAAHLAEQRENESPPRMTQQQIITELNAISEYAVLDYRYTNVAEFEDKIEFYGWKVPLTGKSFVISYDGSMKLGIAETPQVQLLGDEIIIRLPPISVLSHEIFEDSLQILEQTKNLFNPLKIEDYATFAADQKLVVEQDALADGLYDEARANAEAQLSDMLARLPGINGVYTISFS